MICFWSYGASTSQHSKLLYDNTQYSPLKFTSIQPFRHQPFSSLSPRRSPKIPVARWSSHQILHFPRLRAILPLVNYSRCVTPLRKNARSSLVAMSDADLKGVIVKPSNQGTSTIMIHLLDNHLAYSSRSLNHRLHCLDVGFKGGERRWFGAREVRGSRHCNCSRSRMQTVFSMIVSSQWEVSAFSTIEVENMPDLVSCSDFDWIAFWYQTRSCGGKLIESPCQLTFTQKIRQDFMQSGTRNHIRPERFEEFGKIQIQKIPFLFLESSLNVPLHTNQWRQKRDDAETYTDIMQKSNDLLSDCLPHLYSLHLYLKKAIR